MKQQNGVIIERHRPLYEIFSQFLRDCTHTLVPHKHPATGWGATIRALRQLMQNPQDMGCYELAYYPPLRHELSRGVYIHATAFHFVTAFYFPENLPSARLMLDKEEIATWGSRASQLNSK